MTDYKIMPVVQLAAHAKSSTLYGRSYSRTVARSYRRTSKFFRLDGLLLFCMIMGLHSASSPISMFNYYFELQKVFPNQYGTEEKI